MKRQYISPAIFEHKLSIESQILAASPIIKKGVETGNILNSTVAPDELTPESYDPDAEQNTIEAVGSGGFYGGTL